MKKMKKNMIAVITVLSLLYGFSLQAQGVQEVELCYGQSITITANAKDAGDNPTYQWYLDGDMIEDATDNFYTYTPVIDGTVWCEVTSTEECADPETITSVKVSITVNPLPVFPTLANHDVCNDAPLSAIAFSGTYVDNERVIWEVVDGDGTSIGMDANNGTGTIPAFTAINTTDEPITVTIKATPVSEKGCEGTVETFTITVNPSLTPSFEFELELTYCVGDVPVELPEVSENGINGEWDIKTISTATEGVTTYTFTPYSSECVGDDGGVIVVTVTVKPNLIPDFGFGLELEYCQNAVADELLTESINGVTGTWFPTEISTKDAGTEIYTFTPEGGQCLDGDGIVEIEVTVNPTVIPSVDIEVEIK
jgi:hypothetical protein